MKKLLLYLRNDLSKEKSVNSITQTIRDFADKNGAEVLIYPEIDEDIDLVIAVGGDGTFLDASHIAFQFNKPIVGINAGTLGFLTEVKMDEIEKALFEIIVDRTSTIQKRAVLTACLIRENEEIFESTVINEVVVSRYPAACMLEFYLLYDNLKLPDYKADGIIVATPSGSTAYNLSFNGPILFPTVHSYIINAMAPHALTHRPVVLPSNKTLEIIVNSDGRTILNVDGRRSFKVQKNDKIVITEADHELHFIPSSERNFFDILSEKLHWGRRS